MENNADRLDIRNILKSHGLKITPQRILILEAVYSLKLHPTADQIISYVRLRHPDIAIGTVYKVLDVLESKGLIKRVKTDKDIMRYDWQTNQHHHLYCIECDYIEDYKNSKLDMVLQKFFLENKIDNFEIANISLQINGNFIKHKSKQ